MVIIRYLNPLLARLDGLVENHVVYALEGDVFGAFQKGKEVGPLENVTLLAPSPAR